MRKNRDLYSVLHMHEKGTRSSFHKNQIAFLVTVDRGFEGVKKRGCNLCGKKRNSR